jgi:hypothetical protein
VREKEEEEEEEEEEGRWAARARTYSSVGLPGELLYD